MKKNYGSTKDKAVGVEILMALAMKIAVFWDMTPCRLVKRQQ
jgi:hypothetical protein